MEEHWIRWEPIPGLLPKYWIDKIIDDCDGFKIFLSDSNDNNKVEITFQSSVDAYRSTDESYRLDLMNTLDKQYKNSLYAYWTFFKVENSSYIKWLSEQSHGTIESPYLTHFCFVDADSFFDVVTNYEPTVTLVK